MVLYFLFVPRSSLFTGNGRTLSVLLHHLRDVASSQICISKTSRAQLRRSSVSLEAHMKSRTNGIEGR